jgi:hypothetical protein
MGPGLRRDGADGAARFTGPKLTYYLHECYLEL